MRIISTIQVLCVSSSSSSWSSSTFFECRTVTVAVAIAIVNAIHRAQYLCVVLEITQNSEQSWEKFQNFLLFFSFSSFIYSFILDGTKALFLLKENILLHIKIRILEQKTENSKKRYTHRNTWISKLAVKPIFKNTHEHEQM